MKENQKVTSINKFSLKKKKTVKIPKVVLKKKKKNFNIIFNSVEIWIIFFTILLFY